MKVIPIVGVLIILPIVGYFIFSSSSPAIESTLSPTASSTSTPQSQEIAEIKAAFAIFTNGTFRAFTASMYHNRSTDVYIGASNPNIVHVKKEDVTWDDFFKTLPFKLTKECLTTGSGETFCTNNTQTLKLYLNGKLDADALDRKIAAGDQLLVSYGSSNDPEIEVHESLPLPGM